MKKKCVHDFKHSIVKGKTIAGTNALWLIHVCKKCGERDSGTKIRNLPKKRKKSFWDHFK